MRENGGFLKILALDLGTKTGVAFGERTVDITTRAWAKPSEISKARKLRMDRRQDPRLVTFFDYLKRWNSVGVDAVVFEDVQFSSSTMQTQLWASWRTAVWLAFPPPTIIECVPTGTLKKFAGRGNLDKDGMSRALKTQHPDLWRPEYDDNAIDAVWIWLWAKHTLGRMKNNP
jgi:hypothetical protein